MLDNILAWLYLRAKWFAAGVIVTLILVAKVGGQ
jgi:hypothetical protein